MPRQSSSGVHQLTLACRRSALAQTQCVAIKNALLRVHGDALHVDIKTFRTQGDDDLTRSLHVLGGTGNTGLFTRGVQDAVLEHQADAVVHSLKDLPTRPTPGLKLTCIPTRESPYDLLITATDHAEHFLTWLTKKEPGADSLTESIPRATAQIPPQAITPKITNKITHKATNKATYKIIGSIGTSSLRRQLFLKKAFPLWDFHSLRGNVQTRLNSLNPNTANNANNDNSTNNANNAINGINAINAIVLAEAGLRRLDLLSGVFAKPPAILPLKDNTLSAIRLPVKTIIPAPAQGALAIECRSRDRKTQAYFAALHDEETALLVGLERSVMRIAGAGCHSALGAYAQMHGTAIRLSGMVGHIPTARLSRMNLYADTLDPASLTTMTRRMGMRFKRFLSQRPT